MGMRRKISIILGLMLFSAVTTLGLVNYCPASVQGASINMAKVFARKRQAEIQRSADALARAKEYSKTHPIIINTRIGPMPPPPDMNNKIERIDHTMIGNHAFDGADCIWLDGHWYDSTTGLAENKYVMSGDADQNQPPAIEVYNVNRTPGEEGIGWVDYPCPNKIGHITITDITNDGNIVHFNSSKGDSGTLNLQTHQWDFSK